jgi:hypothetical protein
VLPIEVVRHERIGDLASILGLRSAFVLNGKKPNCDCRQDDGA